MKALLILIIVLSMVILQYHSMGFWRDVTDSWIGYVASIAIEIIALMFWSIREKLLAPMASFVVIGASLIHLSGSSFSALNDIKNSEAKNESIASVNKTLNRINDQNLTWWNTTKKAMDTMVLLHEKDASKKVEFTSNSTVAISSILIEAMMLLLVLIGQVKAILIVSETHNHDIETTENTTETPETQNEITDVDSPMALLAKDILSEMVAWGHKNGYRTETTIRDGLGLGSATFSRLRTVAETGSGMRESTMLDIRRRIEHGRKRV